MILNFRMIKHLLGFISKRFCLIKVLHALLLKISLELYWAKKKLKDIDCNREIEVRISIDFNMSIIFKISM